MRLATGVLHTVLNYAGFFLVLLLCSEECRRLLCRVWQAIPRYPRLKILFYPLTFLLLAAGAALILNSFITLFVTIRFSYD